MNAGDRLELWPRCCAVRRAAVAAKESQVGRSSLSESSWKHESINQFYEIGLTHSRAVRSRSSKASQRGHLSPPRWLSGRRATSLRSSRRSPRTRSTTRARSSSCRSPRQTPYVRGSSYRQGCRLCLALVPTLRALLGRARAGWGGVGRSGRLCVAWLCV